MFDTEPSDSAAGLPRWRLLLYRFTSVAVRRRSSERLAPTARVNSRRDGQRWVYSRCSGGNTHIWPTSSFITPSSWKGRIVGRSPWVR